MPSSPGTWLVLVRSLGSGSWRVVPFGVDPFSHVRGKLA